MPDEHAIKTLIDEIRNRREERALLPAPAFWERMGMANASPAERQAFGQVLQTRHLSFLEDYTRGAVYLVWMGRPSPPVKKARKGEQQAAATLREGERANRLALLSAPPQSLDLTARSFRAVSIRQPWAELILMGRKQQENRTWRTSTGPILIHVSRTFTKGERLQARQNGLEVEQLAFGALAGIVDVVGMDGTESDYAWLLTHPRRFSTPIPYKGAASIMQVPMDVVRSALSEAEALDL